MNDEVTAVCSVAPGHLDAVVAEREVAEARLAQAYEMCVRQQVQSAYEAEIARIRVKQLEALIADAAIALRATLGLVASNGDVVWGSVDPDAVARQLELVTRHTKQIRRAA